MKHHMRFFSGFHLIEILFAVAILGIITAISMPIYSQYIMQARRAEAASTLTRLAAAMEQFHIEHGTYADATLKALKFSETIAAHSYRLTISKANTDNYQLHAIPLGKQARNDRRCATLILYSSSQRSVSGPAGTNECW